MKKIYLTLCIGLASLLSFGQEQDLAPNGSFENGPSDTVITNWTKVAGNVQRRNFVTVNTQGGGQAQILPVMGDYLLFAQNTTSIGITTCNTFAYTERPNTFRMHYAYLPVNSGERGLVLVTLHKWNTLSSKRDTLLNYLIQIPATYPMREGIFDLTSAYTGVDNPDSASILVYAGIPGGALQNTALVLDYLRLSSWKASASDMDPFVTAPTLAPNPMTNYTTLNYQIYSQSQVNIKLYDITGKEVANLFNDEQAPGKHSFTINRAGLSPGVYFCNISSDGFTKALKVVITD